MYDLGDVVNYTLTIKDANGTLADAGSVVCTITLPDNSTNTPTVSHPSTGTYTIAYTTVQSGRHLMRWVATGVNASTQSDVFWVAAADPGLIISLAEARAAIGLQQSFTLNDEDLRELIASATATMEDICGPILAKSCDEWHDGGTSVVALLEPPVISITTVSESYGTYFRTLTLQDLAGSGFDAYGYTVDLRSGILYRRVSGSLGIFAGGRRNVHVVYSAGRQVLPASIVRATRRLIRWLYQTEIQGASTQRGGGPEQTVNTPSGYTVPSAVIQLCGAERKIPGIG